MTDVRDEVATATAVEPRGDFIWYELMTTSAEGAKAFYDKVVGWNIGEGAPEMKGYRMINRDDGGFAGGVLPIDAEMQSKGSRPAWLGYLLVRDVDQTVANIEEDGGRTWMPATDIPNVGRVALISDPQDAPFYVMKPIPPSNDPNAQSDVFSVDQPQHVRWNELSTSDPDAAIDFYRRHFGWGQEGEMDMGEMGKYRFIQANGVNVGAVMRKPPQMPISAWTYYIGVDDIDRAAEAINSSGGHIVHGPIEIPGGEFALNAVDPQGAGFGLVGPRK